MELRNAVHVNAPLGVNLTEARHVLVAEEAHVALLCGNGDRRVDKIGLGESLGRPELGKDC
jgi:hypothetical protein